MAALPNILLCWTDLETTGLDYERDFILEIAYGFTDYLGEPVHDSPQVTSTLTVSNEEIDVLHGVLDRMVHGHPAVREMHEKNDLWNDIFIGLDKPRKTLTAVIDDLSAAAIELGNGFDEVRFAGSNVGFDKRFIETAIGSEVPGFHYRVHDLSTFRPFFRWQDMDLNQFTSDRSTDTHRALVDVIRDIDQWRGIAQAVSQT